PGRGDAVQTLLLLLLLQPVDVHALRITFDGFSTLGHGTIDPGGNFHRVATRQVAGKTRRNFQSQGQFTTAHTTVKFIITGEGSLLTEITGTREIERIVLAE